MGNPSWFLKKTSSEVSSSMEKHLEEHHLTAQLVGEIIILFFTSIAFIGLSDSLEIGWLNV